MQVILSMQVSFDCPLDVLEIKIFEMPFLLAVTKMYRPEVGADKPLGHNVLS